jgi:hypothetical protein
MQKKKNQIHNSLSLIKKRKPNIILNKKLLFNFYDIYILSLQQKGMHFFGITISLKNSVFESGEILKTFPQAVINTIVNIICSKLKEVEFIDFVFTTLEPSQRQGFYHIHMVLGIRSIDSNINSAHLYLLQFFNDKLFTDEFYIVKLPNFIDIKKWFEYISKNLHINDELDVNNFYLFNYSSLNSETHNILITHILYQQENSLEADESLLLGNFFKYTEIYRGNYSNIPGFNFKGKNTLKIFFYINLFMTLNDMFLYKNKLYQKNLDARFSYKYIGEPSVILDFNLPNFFVSKFKSVSHEILLDLFMLDIKNITNFLTKYTNFFKHEKINFNVIEFLDGIYLMDSDTFIPKNLLENCYIITTRFYAEKYKNILKKPKPEKWLALLEKNLGKENLDKFCIQYAQYFYPEDNNVKTNKTTKKFNIFIHGVSSSGKTLLVKKLLINLWGRENISLLSNDSNFPFESLNKHTQLIICDDFNYFHDNKSNLLKLFENAELLINRKHNVPIIILGNKTRENDIMLNDIAFKNRLEVYDFNSELIISSNEYNNILIDEAKIILYCNRLYIKYCNNNKFSRNKSFIINDFLTFSSRKPNSINF